MYMYMYMYIYFYIHMCVYIYIYIYIHTHILCCGGCVLRPGCLPDPFRTLPFVALGG